MKKVLFIGDIHGRTDWIVYAIEALKEDYDIVFVGDYVDSFNKKLNIVDNLQRIIAFKKKADLRLLKDPKRSKVTLLLGNHDYAYMMRKTTASGYDMHKESIYYEIFNKNWDLFNLAWGYENPETGKYTLATHAGITTDYWKYYIADARHQESHYGFIEKIVDDPWKITNMHNVLNVLKDKFGLLWKIGFVRGGSGISSVLWADISELVADPFPEINQVVGHSAWHNQEIFFNKDGTFIAKVDGFGEGVQRLVLNL